jgi:hypothetical protein
MQKVTLIFATTVIVMAVTFMYPKSNPHFESEKVEHSTARTGLPDGLFSNQKYQFG